MSDKEVLVSRRWLERLLEYSERVENSQKGKEPSIEKSAIYGLLGYISSAETILWRK